MKASHLLIIPVTLSSLLLAAAEKTEATRINREETQQRDLTTVNQNVVIAGKLDGTLMLVGGTLNLSGTVTQDVIGFFCDIQIAAEARIERDLILIGGGLSSAKEAQINGKQTHIRSFQDIRGMTATLIPFLPESRDMVLFRVIKIIFWFIIFLGILALFPERITQSAERFTFYSRETVPTGLKGLVTYLLFLVSFILFLFLSLFLIGIPLLLCSMILFFITLAFGRTVLFFSWGKSIARTLRLKRQPGTGLYLVLGIVPYFILKFIPIFGLLILILVDCVAVGISVRFLFRRRLGNG